MRRNCRTGAGLLLVLCVAAGARAQTVAHDEAQEEPSMSPEARAHYDEGISLYLKKDYSAAIAEFQKAHRIDPRREFLFSWAQAERLRGNCAGAIEIYDRYLEENPPRKYAELTRLHLNRCKELVQPPWYKDVAGNSLTGMGVVAVGIGTGFLVSSVANENARSGAATGTEFQRLGDDARRTRSIALVSLSVGGGLIAAGLVRYITRETASKAAPVALWANETGGGLSVAGRF